MECKEQFERVVAVNETCADTEYDIEKPHDECGVVAVYAPGEPVAAIAYAILTGLQHRGESAAGIFVHDPQYGPIGHKGNGLIPVAIPEMRPNTEGMTTLDLVTGSPVATGHVRYSTSESDKAAQPFRGERSGIAVSHNGHIEGLDDVAKVFGINVGEGVSDSHKFTLLLDRYAQVCGGIYVALKEILPRLDGAFCLSIIDGDRVILARDTRGFHPLAVGALEDGKGYVAASESVAFETIGAEHLFDVEPGEIVVIDDNGITSSRIDRNDDPRRCLYEFIYTAREDGVIDGVPVYDVRDKLGRFLAEDSPVEADVVIGMPESGMAAAFGYAAASGIPLVRGVYKNPYAGRSFIQRGAERARTLVDKARVIKSQVCGRRLILVDDSMIKGNSMRVNVQKFRKAGAKEIHVRIPAPTYENPCYMGMDTGNPDELIARNATLEEIRVAIGADSVAYITPDRAQQAVDEVAAKYRRDLGKLCIACSTGEYPFPVPGQTLPRQRAMPVALGMPALRTAVSRP